MMVASSTSVVSRRIRVERFVRLWTQTALANVSLGLTAKMARPIGSGLPSSSPAIRMSKSIRFPMEILTLV